jgi:hypothetical protein
MEAIHRTARRGAAPPGRIADRNRLRQAGRVSNVDGCRATPHFAPEPPRRILIVDDDRALVQSARLRLEQRGDSPRRTHTAP